MKRGHVVKRTKGSYSVVVELPPDPITGQRKQQWTTVKGNEKDANKKLIEILKQIDEGTYTRPTKLTLGAFLDQWLKDSAPNIAPNTAQTYAWFVAHHIKPVLGNVVLSSLSPAQLQQFYGDKLTSGRTNGKGGLSSRSVRYLHITLHKACKSAVKLGLLSRNPADFVDVPKVTRREMQVMDETGVQKVLDAAKTGPYFCLFYLALFTGLRRSELLALRWCDVDLLLCQLSVSRTLHQLNNREIIIRPPKTAKGRRLVSLSPSTVQVLREHRELQEKLRTVTDDSLVFCHADGSPLLPDSVTQAWGNLVRRAGLPGIRLHDCRHTHATLLLRQGVHGKIVQERLGHASISITLDTYSHVAPSLQQAAAAKFDDIVLPVR